MDSRNVHASVIRIRMKGLELLRRELDAVGATDDEYVIFGSTVLYLHGIIEREPGDVDVFVSKRVWGLLLPRKGWRVLVPAAGDPPILNRRSEPELNLFFDWHKRDKWMNPSDVFASATEIDGYMLASVDEVMKHKVEAAENQLSKVQKHLDDIESVRSYNA